MLSPPAVPAHAGHDSVLCHLCQANIPDDWIDGEPYQAFGKFPQSRRLSRGRFREHPLSKRSRSRRHNLLNQQIESASHTITSSLVQWDGQGEPCYSNIDELLRDIFPNGRYTGQSYSVDAAE